MKKIFTLFGSVLLSVSIFALTPQAGDAWDATTATLTINSDPGSDPYVSNTEIELLMVGADVEKISAYAFAECSNLQSIAFAPSAQLDTIGESAFYGTAVATLMFPESITTLEASAFAYCAQLSSVVFPASLQKIGSGAFENCDNMESVTIHANALAEYDAYAFHDCDLLAHIYVPASSVATYKANWPAYADKIEAIQERPSGIEQTSVKPAAENRKLMQGGILLILRDDQTYTLTGQALK